MTVCGVSCKIAAEGEAPAHANQEKENVPEHAQDRLCQGRIEEREAAGCTHYHGEDRGVKWANIDASKSQSSEVRESKCN